MDVSTQATRAAAHPAVPEAAPSPPPVPSRDKAAAARTALLTGPVLPALVRLALPTMSVLVAQTAVNVAEAYYVGLLGTDALAGAALVFPIFMLMTMMSNGGIGSGVSSAVARAIGAGRHADADAVAFHAIVLAVIAGALFTLATALCGPALYHALGGRDGALEAALRYSNYLFAGAVPVWIVNLQAAALRGAGNVRVPALVTLIGAVMMIPASPVLIFGLGPLPGLGIAGAGIAFGLYYCGAMLVLVRYMASGRSSLHVRIAPLQIRLFADILKVGLPTALNAVLVNLTVILVTALAGRFGTSELAAYGIASRLDYIMIPLLFGLCTATLTMVGINVGAGQGARARRIAWISAATGAALVGGIGLIVALHPPLWLTLFSRDADVLREGTIYLRTVAPAYAALGFGFVLAFAGQGAGHVLWPFIGSILRILVAAGGGFVAIVMLGGGMASLAAMVALSLVVYALVCSLVLRFDRIWGATAR
ncbi:MATE family efflux transporter [Bradyrhizobium sp. SSBR45G]|uniref:MATE family efflux transporter n=1 Tax=unclassified Bradyrhizobium TaxID=2631580 RepID=UPI002342B141|nr:MULTISPECIES: MATE family efflux transporter [unclassified Bradyrhizobium]GLH80163.1 MATE family efflux transporter [Bradyrhizobium sp. SSBR45G]GLH87656.1 MATE family efflux transporter [Bradyrhizobium sp. SSBR45R]